MKNGGDPDLGNKLEKGGKYSYLKDYPNTERLKNYSEMIFY